MLTLPTITLSGLWPFMGISGLAVLALLINLFGGSAGRRLVIPLSVVGCVVLSVFILRQSDATSTSFSSGLVVAGATQWMTVVFLLCAGLSLMLASHPRFASNALPGELASLVLFSTAGMTLAVQAGDFLMLFLGIELASLPIYCLVGIRKHDKVANEAAIKYFLMGAFSAAIYLFGFAIVFGTTSDIRYGAIAAFHQGTQGMSYPFLRLGEYLLFTSLLFKAAVIPFHMWAPDAYQGAPAPIAGFMSAGVKAMAVFALLLISFPLSLTSLAPLSVLMVVTVLGGNLLALVQNNLKRMLAYSSIAHAGYLLMALHAYPRMNGLPAMVYYLSGYAFMTIGAFAVAGWVAENDSGDCSIDRLKGLYRRDPFAAFALTVFMLGMAGIPPMAGFIGKFYLFKEALKVLTIPVVVAAAIGSAVGVYYYLRVVVACYMEEEEPGNETPRWPVSFRLAIGICALGALALGVFPEPLIQAVKQAVSTFQPY